MKCYQEFIMKSKTKTAYNSIYYKRKTNECFDNILLWIIKIITTFDNHAIDEPDLEIGKPMNCNVVVNHHIELTEEEKAEQRAIALKRYQEEEMRKLQLQQRNSRPKAAKPQPKPIQELSLFQGMEL